MSKIHKIKIEEIIFTIRTRIVDIEVDKPLAPPGKEFDIDEGTENVDMCNTVTELVRNQHSHSNDITEQVTRVKFLT